MNIFALEAILSKTPSNWVVGGVASNFCRDLDGDAIHPSAVAQAIPGFMANRGPDGLKGGPIRLHHDFWQRFLKDAIAALNLLPEQQMELVSAISLPLGRVTEIWVDESGVTRWKGLLSQANPIARTVWGLLKEGLIHLGVSVGGKILGTRAGRDALGQPCTLIDRIRLDELSITDNPALRLLSGESPSDNGAYIVALQKSLQKSTDVDSFLRKALGDAGKETSSGVWGGTTTGIARPINNSSLQPRVSSSKGVQLDHSQPATGMGERQPKAQRPAATGAGPATDVWGMTVSQITSALTKCARMDKAEWAAPETVAMLTDSAHALAGATGHPPPVLINLVRFLQELNRFAQELPYMSDYQAAGTVAEMGPQLLKSLAQFKEQMPKELMGAPVRPPGALKPTAQYIAFPKQYVSI